MSFSTACEVEENTPFTVTKAGGHGILNSTPLESNIGRLGSDPGGRCIPHGP